MNESLLFRICEICTNKVNIATDCYKELLSICVSFMLYNPYLEYIICKDYKDNCQNSLS